MNYKSMILTSLWIFSSSFIAPVFGMEDESNAKLVKVEKKTPKSSKQVSPKSTPQIQQPNNNAVAKGMSTIKSLKRSFDNILVKKPQQPRQQKQNVQPQQQQQKLPQQKIQQQKTQFQQSQQKTQVQGQRKPQELQRKKQQNIPSQQLQQQQKENIPSQKSQQQPQKPRQQKAPQQQSLLQQKVEHQPQQKLQQLQQKQNNTTVHNNDNVVKVEQIKKPSRGQNRNKVKTAQDAAVISATKTILQNERNKKIQQLGGNKKQNVQLVVKKEQKNIGIAEQDVEPEIIHSKSRVRICDHFHNREIIVFKDSKDILLPGTYYRTQKGLMPVPVNLKSNNGLPMVKNHLSQLIPLNNGVLTKTDCLHNFPKCVEKECGEWARVVIRNAKDDPQQILDNAKKFHMYATVRGQINTIEFDSMMQKPMITKQLPGVFEFEIVKGLYDKEGKCAHRFLNPKGTVGAEGFGEEYRNKQQKKLNSGLITNNHNG